MPILPAKIARESRVMIDEAGHYVHLGSDLEEHRFVKHGADEYVSLEDATVHTNTTEGYFSVFERGMKGMYQHCAKRHLHRYLAEFDFRYTSGSLTPSMTWSAPIRRCTA